MSDRWIPPWKPGLPHARCTECFVEHVAMVLLEDGRCVSCALDRKPASQPDEAEPVQESLFATADVSGI